MLNKNYISLCFFVTQSSFDFYYGRSHVKSLSQYWRGIFMFLPTIRDLFLFFIYTVKARYSEPRYSEQ